MGSTHRGWKYDATNGRLAAQFNGTEAFDFAATDVAFAVETTFASSVVFNSAAVTFHACGFQLTSAGCGDSITVKAPACADWSLTLPANDGNCGQQLATNGSGVTTWAAACSSIETKDILGPTCKFEAFDRVKNTTIYDYNYKPGFGLKSKVPYTGPIAEEAPFLMRGGQRPIFSEINGFGHLTAAFQVLAEKVESLEAKLDTCNA